jgi:hypothetical protein
VSEPFHFCPSLIDPTHPLCTPISPQSKRFRYLFERKIGTETATHALYPSTISFDHLTSAQRSFFEETTLLFSIPRGLTFGGGSALSGTGPQFELFKSMLKGLRTRVETMLSAVYTSLFDRDDDVKLIPFNPTCEDIDSLINLQKAGLLPPELGARLVGEALGEDCSNAHGEKAVDVPRTSLSEPAGSRAPSPDPSISESAKSSH